MLKERPLNFELVEAATLAAVTAMPTATPQELGLLFARISALLWVSFVDDGRKPTAEADQIIRDMLAAATTDALELGRCSSKRAKH